MEHKLFIAKIVTKIDLRSSYPKDTRERRYTRLNDGERKGGGGDGGSRTHHEHKTTPITTLAIGP